MKRVLAPILILAVGVIIILVGCKATRGGYESAPCHVLRSDGKFELRDYPALIVVQTSMVQPGSGADDSFSRLFRFITGRNEGQQKIAMTTPVLMSGSGSNATMAFVMPAKLKATEVPKPADELLQVRKLEPGRFAVLRFSGGRNSENEAKALERLKAWVQAQRLRALSGPVYGYFDPPWTPAFLRRNEVMLRTETDQP